MARPDFRRTLAEFQTRFATEEACVAYLHHCRWEEGFRCPRCGHARSYVLTSRALEKCAACAYQVSVTAGTVLHRTKLPLRIWFWVAYFVSTHTPGISALQLQRQLGLQRYETAWTVLQKLRRAMIRPERDLIPGRWRWMRLTSEALRKGTMGTTDSREVEVFSDANAFDEYLQSIVHAWSKTLALLGFSLIPLFFVLDAVMLPGGLLPRFGLYRLLVTLIVLGQYTPLAAHPAEPIFAATRILIFDRRWRHDLPDDPRPGRLRLDLSRWSEPGDDRGQSAVAMAGRQLGHQQPALDWHVCGDQLAEPAGVRDLEPDQQPLLHEQHGGDRREHQSREAQPDPKRVRAAVTAEDGAQRAVFGDGSRQAHSDGVTAGSADDRRLRDRRHDAAHGGGGRRLLRHHLDPRWGTLARDR